MEQNPKSDFSIEDAAASFAALGSEQRLAILHVLVRVGPKGTAIGTLATQSGVSGSTLTHHLKILTQAKLVQQTKQGRSIICAAVAYERIEALNQFLLQECCADCTDADKDQDRG